jgi:hypothetical protein
MGGSTPRSTGDETRSRRRSNNDDRVRELGSIVRVTVDTVFSRVERLKELRDSLAHMRETNMAGSSLFVNRKEGLAILPDGAEGSAANVAQMRRRSRRRLAGETGREGGCG